jgi:hypothetical protein
MGMGLIPVINRVTDLPLHFDEGTHYHGFSDENEAVEKIKWALEHDFDAKYVESIAKKRHTFKHRVKQIMETVWK